MNEILMNTVFTVYDRKKCLPIIKKLYELAMKARKTGILSLENEVERLEEHFFKKALLLIIYGYAPKEIEKILDNYMIFSAHNRDEMLQHVVIKEGILAIYNGHEEEFVLEILLSIMGAEFEKEVEEYLSEFKESRFPLKAPSRIDVIGKVRSLEGMALPVEKGVFDNVVATMSEDDLRLLVSKVYDNKMFIYAIAGAPYETKFRLITSLSNVVAYKTVKKIKQLPKLSATDVIDAQKEILQIIEEL